MRRYGCGYDVAMMSHDWCMCHLWLRIFFQVWDGWWQGTQATEGTQYTSKVLRLRCRFDLISMLRIYWFHNEWPHSIYCSIAGWFASPRYSSSSLFPRSHECHLLSVDLVDLSLLFVCWLPLILFGTWQWDAVLRTKTFGMNWETVGQYLPSFWCWVSDFTEVAFVWHDSCDSPQPPAFF